MSNSMVRAKCPANQELKAEIKSKRIKNAQMIILSFLMENVIVKIIVLIRQKVIHLNKNVFVNINGIKKEK